MKFDPKKILIILHGSIGDVTRALPLANLLRRGFPKASLAWAVEPASFPLLQHYPAVDEVIVFERRYGLKGIGPFLRKIRSRHFDLVLDLQRILKSGLISWLSGAPCRLGFNRLDCKEFNWVFNNQFIPPFGDGLPKIDHYMKFAEYLGLKSHPVEWSLQLTKEEESRVDEHLAEMAGAFAVLFVGSRWESKRWFPTQMTSCMQMIQQRFGLDVVLLGSRQDQVLAEEAQNCNPYRLRNLVGCTSLRDAIGIIARARVAVGPDTGLVHIAAAVGTPVVSLWGATSPLRTGPYGFDDLVVQGRAACSPCYLRKCPIGRICMQSIETEEIVKKISMALSRGNAKGLNRDSGA